MTPEEREVDELLRAFYQKPGNAAGGVLHIVADDGNVDDDDVEFCMRLAEESGDTDALDIAKRLMAMTLSQREKLTDAYSYAAFRWGNW